MASQWTSSTRSCGPCELTSLWAPKLRDHALSGDWKGWRDCHVEPDWVLIYMQEAGRLILGRTGTHSDLGF